MLMFVISSLFMIILLLIAVISSPATSSVSTSAYASTVNSTYSIFNTSTTTTTTNLIDQKDKNNSILEFEITDKIKALIIDRLDKNQTNAAIVIGFIDPNGTQFYGHGKTSSTSNATVNENTVFSIGSTTKVFTTILLADMVNKGLVKLDDPIEKYLPFNVIVPQYKGHKITIENLLLILQDYQIFPIIIVLPSILQKQQFRIQFNTEKI